MRELELKFEDPEVASDVTTASDDISETWKLMRNLRTEIPELDATAADMPTAGEIRWSFWVFASTRNPGNVLYNLDGVCNWLFI